MSTLYQDLNFTTFPNNLQNFVTMLNMTAQDGSLVKQFQAAMEAGDQTLAQTYYNQITNANQKFIDSTKLNTLMQTCVALERFYKTDIQPYITTKQAEWQAIINKFSYKNAYNPLVQYEQNNFVMYNLGGVSFLYICTTTPPSTNIAPVNTTYWRQLTIRGVRGPAGSGLAFLYEWDANQPYVEQDAVTYNNCLWGCTLANTNQVPFQGSTYWQLIGNISQVIYPFSAQPPVSQVTGELWFKNLGVAGGV